MKLIIDIPEDEYNAIKNTAFVEDEKTIFRQNANDRKCSMGLFHIVDEVKNGTPIPDNATNGEMIKAMFGYKRISHFNNNPPLVDVYGLDNNDDTDSVTFYEDWWNSPYQKGGNE